MPRDYFSRYSVPDAHDPAHERDAESEVKEPDNRKPTTGNCFSP